jgi:hypothetical protein
MFEIKLIKDMIYTINDGIVYKNNKIEVFHLPLNISWF